MAESRNIEPGSPEWRARAATMLAAEYGRPPTWWYLSFAEPGHFLGAVIIHERGFTHALRKSHRLGINPGGGVQAWELGSDLPSVIDDSMVDRLLTKTEVENIGRRPS